MEKEKATKYWTGFLRRVVDVKFLAETGLAFYGSNELHNNPNNGNFLGHTDLLSEFDLYVKEHTRNNGNPGTGNLLPFFNHI
jgi:hypothetical protein